MAENEKDCGSFLRGFVIGGVLGALAGIFFAPKSGKELRSNMKEKGSEVLKGAKEAYPPISLEPLSDRDTVSGSPGIVPISHISLPYSTASSRSPSVPFSS